MNTKPFIKCFKTRDKAYVYDVNKNIILNINNNEYNALKKSIQDNNKISIESERLRKLYKKGFFAPSNIEEIIHPADELLDFRLDNDVKMLILQVTQQCNFRCDYCIYSGSYLNRSHSDKRMSVKTAFKGIDFIIEHSKNNDEIFIGFYGGEPLLDFELIKQCINYAEKKVEGKKVSFNITTNGSLLTKEITKFLYEHDVLLAISLDGSKEIQDANRKFAANNSGTFDAVIKNIINIQKMYPDYISKLNFSTVIDTNNNFDVINNFFLNNNAVKNIRMTASPISKVYEKEQIKINTYDEDFYLKNAYELFRIFYYKIRKKVVPNCSKITIDDFNQLINFSKKLIPQKNIPKKTHPSGPCIPGVHRLFMNVYGDFYPCEKASEVSEIMKIGNVYTGFDISKIKNIMNIGKVNETECKNCWALRFCNICACSIDNATEEFDKEKKKKICKRVRLSIEEILKNYCFLNEFGYKFDDYKKTNIFHNKF